MPAAAITQNVHFQHAPNPGHPVAVNIPAHFDAAAAFIVCVFLHGRGGDVPFENHIAAATGQMDSATINAILVAPRFNDAVDPGTFAQASVFPRFVAELASVLPPLLKNRGVAEGDAARCAAYAAKRAPLVLVDFSGGFRPLNSIVASLLPATGAAPDCTDRVIGIALLDSIYGNTSSSGPLAWQKKRRAQSTLLSIYGRNTGDNAPAANVALIGKLRVQGPVTELASADQLTAAPAGSVAFLEVATTHQLIPRHGPPEKPIATFLDLLADRLARLPMV